MGTVCGDATAKGSRGMIRRMRDGWWRFKAGKPGHRFRNRYRRNRRSGQGRFATRKVLVIVGGIVIVVASLLLAPLPGPGWGTLILGLVILAGELLILARPHKTPDRHSSSGLWRRIGAVGPFNWLAVVNVGEVPPSIQETGFPRTPLR